MDRRSLIADERGTLHKEAETRVALVYPSPYRAAMSSLGYQQIYRVLHGMPGVAADRAMLDVPKTLEEDMPISSYPLLAYSVAYELELAGVVETLDRAGIPALASERDDRHPLVIAGGPLTFSNPAPMAPFFDVIVMGEGEEVIIELMNAARDAGFLRDRLWTSLVGRPGFYLPHLHGEKVPPVAAADDALLPARSVIQTPNTELSNMFMTEAARGCSRGCTYCVMRRSTNGGMRIVPRESIIAGIPEYAHKVGLVGAAVTDHPDIVAVVRDIVDGGRSVGISSLRADKLTDELVRLLAKGGYRTLTVAGDGASERMRRVIERSTKAEHLIHSAQLAATHRLHTLKVYMMLGVPSETDADVDELVQLSRELAAIHPRVAYGLAPFVAKRNTPLDGTPFAGIDVVEHRLVRLRAGLKAAGLGGKVEVRPTSARWAWVEYMLAQGEMSAGLAVMDAHRAGGTFAAYKKAFIARGVVPTGPRARVPSSQELIALKRQRLATLAT
ncbi:MAG: radical SAM protein [Deltaproteobacteria bacterium]|nr:radical SAM protein [Deltaproteobacteria bacterium]MDQ3296348.1 B12-binding domain-containing radical SAM protein [Myxococcota bacterium]